MENIVEVLITVVNFVLVLYCSWMYRMYLKGMKINEEYFDAVREKVDYSNLWSLPGLIKLMEDHENYEQAAKLKKVLDDSRKRLKI